VLIRRDGVEHLILLAPNAETVIETRIESGSFSQALSTQTKPDPSGATA